MTKRASTMANVFFPPHLRMASEHGTDFDNGLLAHMPLPSLSPTPKFYFHSPFQQTQWRQRIVHTHTFKVYEYGNRTPELMVEEVDASGHSRVRSLEQFLFVIMVMFVIEMGFLLLMNGTNRLN